jgi:GNAT superfamily N-acetyltransferase
MDIPEPRVEEQPDERDIAFVARQLHAFNIASTGYTDYRPLAVFLRDATGAIAGGLTGFTWGKALKIEYLWLRADWRGRGLGTRLVKAAEREAIARGCRSAVVDTHSFQAPDFYPRLGYARCGVAADWPMGHQQHYFQRALG